MKSILSILVFLITFGSAFSQEEEKEEGVKHPLLTDKFIIGAGWYFPNRDIKFAIEGNVTIDNENLGDIDFDETLGLSEGDNTFNFNFYWRFSKSKFWSVRGEYFKVGSTRNVTLDEDIEWEDITYPALGEAEVSYGVGLYRVFFGRTISSGQKHELGGGLGIHGLNVKASVAGQGSIGDQSAGFNKSEVSIFLPLPNIGIWYTWAPTDKWAFTANLDWFGINIDNISGGLWNFSPGVNYQIIRNLGVNLNYEFITFSADIDNTDFRGGFDLEFSGPSFRVIGNF